MYPSTLTNFKYLLPVQLSGHSVGLLGLQGLHIKESSTYCRMTSYDEILSKIFL